MGVVPPRGLRSGLVEVLHCPRNRGHFRFHNTRHSAVTNVNAADIPDTVATTITGHRPLQVYKRDGIRQPAVQRAAMEKVEHYLQAATPAEDKKQTAS